MSFDDMDNITINNLNYHTTDQVYRDVTIITQQTTITEFDSNKKIKYIVVLEQPLLTDIPNGKVVYYDGCSEYTGYPTFKKLKDAKSFIDETSDSMG